MTWRSDGFPPCSSPTHPPCSPPCERASRAMPTRHRQGYQACHERTLARARARAPLPAWTRSSPCRTSRLLSSFDPRTGVRPFTRGTGPQGRRQKRCKGRKVRLHWGARCALAKWCLLCASICVLEQTRCPAAVSVQKTHPHERAASFNPADGACSFGAAPAVQQWGLCRAGVARGCWLRRRKLLPLPAAIAKLPGCLRACLCLTLLKRGAER